MNVCRHIDELASSSEAQAFRVLTERLSEMSEIEPSKGLTSLILKRVELESRCRRDHLCSYAFRPWFGALAAAVVVFIVLALRFLYPASDSSANCVLSDEQWLADSQEQDGSWNPARHGGANSYCPSLTALSALALYRSGGDYSDAVQQARRYLISKQQTNGSFGGEGRELFYNQAIVTFVLAETGSSVSAIETLNNAVDFIHSRQAVDGSWGYATGSEGSQAITAWQVQALSSAKKNGIVNADVCMRKGLRWLRDIASSGKQMDYNIRSGRSSDTISALAGYVLVTAGSDFPEISALGRNVVASIKQQQDSQNPNLYRDCMKVRALKAIGRNAGAQSVKKQMVAVTDDIQNDQWGKVGGRLYYSSMHTLARTY